ncbi:MAG: NADH-quinone oxidoreductase subunit I [Dehalococcoidales bacterium]|nr:NADH-quinone oxidoreductase subunit I [Dehalococcoidales bacterium]
MEFKRSGQGMAKGMWVVLQYLFRHPITNQYPEQRLNVSRRIRGNELIWSEEKCTGCQICARACHISAINMTVDPVKVEKKNKVFTYEVDTGYCIMCGLCVESCPWDALHMGYDYERAKYKRGDLVQSKEMMKETPERHVSGYFYPERAAKLPTQTLLIDKIAEKK